MNIHKSNDYLFRISLKCLILNKKGEVLVVKETGRDRWDLPGGGMDHGESLHSAIAREMKEEVCLTGDFTYKIIEVEEPAQLSTRDIWQMRLIFAVSHTKLDPRAGEDGDEIAFIEPRKFEKSDSEVEQRIFGYSKLV